MTREVSTNGFRIVRINKNFYKDDTPITGSNEIETEADEDTKIKSLADSVTSSLNDYLNPKEDK
jgi:hypothetical protein